jgi:hypothetical protein
MADLKELYKWFDENRNSIINDHQNECVLLKDNSVIGYYPDDESALSAAEEKGFIMGEFLIQDCITSDDVAMIYYNPAVSFG